MNPHYDLVGALEERTEANEMLWDAGEMRPDFLDDPALRLVPWASTDNGEFIYWVVDPARAPDEWEVAVNEARGDDWQKFPLGFSGFLSAVLQGEITSELLSSDFPLAVHQFEPSDPARRMA